MKIFLDMVGCRLNQSEIERFANIFRALGHEIVPAASNADMAIINTCAVTVKAAADSRKKIRRAVRDGARQVVVTGCWSTMHPEKAAGMMGVTAVIGNPDKDHLVSILLNLDQKQIDALSLIREPLPGGRGRTRAFIKVQEGCDNVCTYCLTRVARGRSRSRPVDDIRRDLHSALRGGAREIVLTGVQLGAWGRDFTPSAALQDLISAALDLPDLERLRLSSIEPWDFSPDLLVHWQDARLCRHLHLPLQSGSDRILKAMGRPLTTSDYAALINQIRNIWPDAAITTDVITGFPGESSMDFEQTKAFIQEMRFAGGHVFTYSPRPQTAAFKMKERVPIQTARARNAALRDVFKKSSRDFRTRFIGDVVRVLWERDEQQDDGCWRLSGLTDHYLRVQADSSVSLWNQFSRVKITGHDPERPMLLGEIVG